MFLVVDGYNVIYAVRDLERDLDRGLRAARSALIQVSLEILKQVKAVKRIILVFDGSSQVLPLGEERFSDLEIVYTESGEDADDRIIEILRSLPEKTSVTVVSNDRYVREHARALSAILMEASQFYQMKFPKKRVPAVKKSGKEEVPLEIARHITEEYKKHLGIE